MRANPTVRAANTNAINILQLTSWNANPDHFIPPPRVNEPPAKCNGWESEEHSEGSNRAHRFLHRQMETVNREFGYDSDDSDDDSNASSQMPTLVRQEMVSSEEESEEGDDQPMIRPLRHNNFRM